MDEFHERLEIRDDRRVAREELLCVHGGIIVSQSLQVNTARLTGQKI
jgi:hypothetical protein